MKLIVLTVLAVLVSSSLQGCIANCKACDNNFCRNSGTQTCIYSSSFYTYATYCGTGKNTDANCLMAGAVDTNAATNVAAPATAGSIKTAFDANACL